MANVVVILSPGDDPEHERLVSDVAYRIEQTREHLEEYQNGTLMGQYWSQLVSTCYSGAFASYYPQAPLSRNEQQANKMKWHVIGLLSQWCELLKQTKKEINTLQKVIENMRRGGQDVTKTKETLNKKNEFYEQCKEVIAVMIDMLDKSYDEKIGASKKLLMSDSEKTIKMAVQEYSNPLDDYETYLTNLEAAMLRYNASKDENEFLKMGKPFKINYKPIEMMPQTNSGFGGGSVFPDAPTGDLRQRNSHLNTNTNPLSQQQQQPLAEAE